MQKYSTLLFIKPRILAVGDPVLLVCVSWEAAVSNGKMQEWYSEDVATPCFWEICSDPHPSYYNIPWSVEKVPPL